MHTEQQLQEIIDNDCIAITPDFYQRSKNIFQRLTTWFAYEVVRVIFYLFTFYFKHKK